MTTPPSKIGIRHVPPPAAQDEISRSESDFKASRRAETSPSDPLEITGLLSTSDTGLVSARRLIVLVPDQSMDETEVARRVWQIASPPRLGVLFLGVCSDSSKESYMRRRLATLSSLTRDPRVTVETKLDFGKNWSKRVKTLLTQGDVLLCHAEHRTGLWRKPLSQILSRLGVPVWTMVGLYVPTNPSPLTEIIFWFISITIFAGFFVLQVRIIHMPKDWAYSASLYFSILVEAGLLWAWHHLSS